MRGYYTEEAIVVATESRTSAPVRIPRDAETLMHPEVEKLFPCGEGAGYARWNHFSSDGRAECGPGCGSSPKKIIRACSGFSAVGKNRLIFCQFLRF
jgi:hypothetical protein